jgi:hypothetical protein
MRSVYKILVGNPKEKNHSKEISGNRRTELRWISRKLNVRVRSVFM